MGFGGSISVVGRWLVVEGYMGGWVTLVAVSSLVESSGLLRFASTVGPGTILFYKKKRPLGRILENNCSVFFLLIYMQNCINQSEISFPEFLI